MLTAVLFITPSNWTEPTYPATGEWLNYGTYQGIENNRKDKLLIHITLWINVQGIMLSEKN